MSAAQGCFGHRPQVSNPPGEGSPHGATATSENTVSTTRILWVGSVERGFRRPAPDLDIRALRPMTLVGPEVARGRDRESHGRRRRRGRSRRQADRHCHYSWTSRQRIRRVTRETGEGVGRERPDWSSQSTSTANGQSLASAQLPERESVFGSSELGDRNHGETTCEGEQHHDRE